MGRFFTLICVLAAGLFQPVKAAMVVANDGKSRCVILQSPNAIAPEVHAAHELAQTLNQITGGTFQIETSAASSTQAAIILGPGPAATALFPEVNLGTFGPEEYVMQVKGNHLLLAGGRPRGTLYAVYRFLQEQCGVCWWTPWATSIPHRSTLRVSALNVRNQPAFEYRGPYWFAGFDPVWKAHNGANDESHLIPPELGGCVIYKGFCHTFYPLVPPDKYFATHPEWYSLINGKRTHDNAQLCLSNPQLRDFVVQRAKEWLRKAPDASIISITQNDCFNPCECPDCKALDDAEGSHSGSMLAFVNYIAEKLEPEFSNIAVDTFAYQYTRKPPKTIKPRHNVIVRLCSIECNFREPLDHPSNAAFLADLEEWSKICPRLYIWDYVTDFSHYIIPHPNWFTLGPNIRIFQKYGVKGVFEEGAYAGPGAEMAELRSWVLAQLLWNPQQDDRALINEFLAGYYGKAARPIRRYLDLMYGSSKDFFVACYLRKDPPYLKFEPLAQAERLWQEAEKAVASDPELLQRARIAHLPVRCAWLRDWVGLRRACWESNGEWPLSSSRKAVADEFRSVAQGIPGKDWTQVRVMSEAGLQVDKFLADFAVDPPDTNGPAPSRRLSHPGPPTDLRDVAARRCVDLQDNLATLYKPGEFAEIRPDSLASDHRAVWMPGGHQEWAFRIPGARLPARAQHGKWMVYAVVRVERAGDGSDGVAFGAGVYDIKSHTYPADLKVSLRESNSQYHSYLLGAVELNADRDIFVAPAANKNVRSIYVDRIYLVPVTIKND